MLSPPFNMTNVMPTYCSCHAKSLLLVTLFTVSRFRSRFTLMIECRTKTKGEGEKMKAVKVSGAFIILSLIIFLSISCTSTSSATPTAKTHLVTVQPGNISTKVTGTGNLALENKQGLSFGQTGLVTQAVTVKVSDVLVTAGQTVDAGAVLVKADPQNWQTQIIADQHALDAKKVGLVQAQTSVVDAQTGLATAQNGLAQAQNSLATAQNGLATAQTNLATAQYNLNVQKDVKAAQDAIDQANNQLQTDQVLAQRALTLGST